MTIANTLMVNDQTCGEASQLVERVSIVGKWGGFRILVMYDLGTSCSVIDIALAERCALRKEQVDFVISTVTGSQKGTALYTFLVRNESNNLLRVQALGVTIKQYYAAARIQVRDSWSSYFGGPFQISQGGDLGLLLGSDQSQLHPHQVAFEEREVLWRSCLSGDYLITWGDKRTRGQCFEQDISVPSIRRTKEGKPCKKGNKFASGRWEDSNSGGRHEGKGF